MTAEELMFNIRQLEDSLKYSYKKYKSMHQKWSTEHFIEWLRHNNDENCQTAKHKVINDLNGNKYYTKLMMTEFGVF